MKRIKTLNVKRQLAIGHVIEIVDTFGTKEHRKSHNWYKEFSTLMSNDPIGLLILSWIRNRKSGIGNQKSEIRLQPSTIDLQRLDCQSSFFYLVKSLSDFT
jgi:hypothetical protein